jgi:Tfp pilus assembly protein PilF
MPQFVRRCLCACLVSTFVAGCQSKPANPEELLRARSLGLGYLERNRLPEAEQQFKLIVAGAPKDPFGYANLALT